MTKFEEEEYLKEKFLDARRNRKADDRTWTYEELCTLRDMAKKDVWPDWRFGDDDCCVWSLFHNLTDWN